MSGPKDPKLPAATGKGPPVLEERRTSSRYAFTAAAEVTDMKSHARINARISDLALEGAYVDTGNPFPVGTIVRVRITNASRAFETLATVTYALANMGMGLSFAPPDPEQLWVLQKWLDELSGKLPSEFEPPAHAAPQHLDSSSADSQLAVLRELLTILMRNGILSHSEANAMLRRLLE